MSKAIGSFLLFRVFGWKIVGDPPPNVKKYVIIGGPHTSNFDFVLAILILWVKQIKVMILGKKELFKPMTGWIFRALNVVPVDRKGSGNQVEAIAKTFDNYEEFVIGLSPEGTRKKVEKFRSGFYYIAKLANVPIVMIGADYEKKQITFAKPYYLTDDKTADFKHFYAFFSENKGKYPEKDFNVEV